LNNNKWWKILCEAEDPELLSFIAIEIGAAGSELSQDSKVIIHFSGNQIEKEKFLFELKNSGALKIECFSEEDKNWVQMCKDVWEPIQVNKLRLVPILSHSDLQKENHCDLFIIPGNGFGTGHHESTRLALKLLQSSEVASGNIKSVLDVGTGNGILALATALLYRVKILAIDNDPLAVANAKENIELNLNLKEYIQIQVGELEETTNKSSMILANIYSHTLCNLQPIFHKVLEPNGLLILSGIMLSQREDIESSFNGPKWSRLQIAQENNWIAYLLKCNH